MIISKNRRIMDVEEAKTIVENLVNDNPRTLRNPEGYLLHVKATSEIALEIAERIKRRYNIPLDCNEVALAAYLHDIGRPLNKNQLLHELTGARWIEENGLEKGIYDNLTDVYRIAQMMRPHGSVYEVFSFEDAKEIRDKLEVDGKIDTSLLIPRTVQEKIITYSDASNINGERVDPRQRMEEATKKYLKMGGDESSWIMHVIKEGGVERQLNVCRRVEDLCEGKLGEKEIWRHGFN